MCSRYYLNCTKNEISANRNLSQQPNNFSIKLPYPINLSESCQLRVDQAFVCGNNEKIIGKPLVLCSNIAEQQICNENYDNVLALVKEGELFQSNIFVPAFLGRFQHIEIILKTSELKPLSNDLIESVSINLSILQ